MLGGLDMFFLFFCIGLNVLMAIIMSSSVPFQWLSIKSTRGKGYSHAVSKQFFPYKRKFTSYGVGENALLLQK